MRLLSFGLDQWIWSNRISNYPGEKMHLLTYCWSQLFFFFFWELWIVTFPVTSLQFLKHPSMRIFIRMVLIQWDSLSVCLHCSWAHNLSFCEVPLSCLCTLIIDSCFQLTSKFFKMYFIHLCTFILHTHKFDILCFI